MRCLTHKDGREHWVSDAIYEQVLKEGALDVVKDGARVRVPIMFMDGRPYQAPPPRFHNGLGRAAGTGPGFVFDSHGGQFAESEKALQEYRQRLTDAWRTPGAALPVVPPPVARQLSATADMRERAYHEMCERLASAWRRRP